MARRIGAQWFDTAVTFDQFITAPKAYYAVGAGADVEIITGLTVETYTETQDDTSVTLYRGTFNGAIPAGALGNNVIVKIYDPQNANDILTYTAIDVCTDVATRAVISPASTGVRIDKTRQFAATFYAADDLSTTNHDAAVWSVAGGGTIGSSTGLFTAGAVLGGPHAVSMTAGAITATPASVTVVKGGAVSGGTAVAIGISICM